MGVSSAALALCQSLGGAAAVGRGTRLARERRHRVKLEGTESLPPMKHERGEGKGVSTDQDRERHVQGCVRNVSSLRRHEFEAAYHLSAKSGMLERNQKPRFRNKVDRAARQFYQKSRRCERNAVVGRPAPEIGVLRLSMRREELSSVGLRSLVGGRE